MKGNVEQVLAVVESVKGVSMASIDTCTEVKLTGGKKNPMLGRVFKVSKGIPVMVCRSSADGSVAYQNKVNRHLAKEGKEADFESAGLASWLEVVSFPLIQHKTNGTQYLQLIYTGTSQDTVYMLDGQPIAKADIIGFPATKTEGHQGGLSDEGKVYVRTPKLDSILEMRVKGEVL